MIDINVLKKIIEAGIQAPSGKNAQPWKFKIDGDKIFIFNRLDRDSSLYNFNNFGSFVSHGAVIENIVIAASAHGYSARVNLFPDKNNVDLTAIIQLDKTVIHLDSLYPYIFKRATNRKPYKIETLNQKEKDAILSVNKELDRGKILIIEDREKIKLLADAVSINERVMLENYNIHNFFFSHIRWTDLENSRVPSGFDLKTLELKPPQLIAFKLFKHWKILKFFNKFFNVSKFVAKENAKIYASSAAMIMITVPNDSPDNFIYAGRLAERFWLKITELGLSAQPLTGVFFLMKGIMAGKKDDFSLDQIKFLDDAYQMIKNIFKVQNETIAMIFRIGFGGTPTAKAARFPLAHFIEFRSD